MITCSAKELKELRELEKWQENNPNNNNKIEIENDNDNDNDNNYCKSDKPTITISPFVWHEKKESSL
jgi:hypothetical protein